MIRLKKTRTVAVIGIAAMLLASCSERRKARATVEAFLNANLTTQDYYVDLLALDSTRRVSDSALADMRDIAAAKGIYKSGTEYAERDASGKLMYIRGKIIAGKDTFVQTFYLTPDLEKVVAVKEN